MTQYSCNEYFCVTIVTRTPIFMPQYFCQEHFCVTIMTQTSIFMPQYFSAKYLCHNMLDIRNKVCFIPHRTLFRMHNGIFPMRTSSTLVPLFSPLRTGKKLNVQACSSNKSLNPSRNKCAPVCEAFYSKQFISSVMRRHDLIPNGKIDRVLIRIKSREN